MEELEKFYPVMKFAEEPLDQVNQSQDCNLAAIMQFMTNKL